jgi:hypothetical protein
LQAYGASEDGQYIPPLIAHRLLQELQIARPTRQADTVILAESVTTQVFRLKAEGYKLSRKARIKPFKTVSVSTTVGSSRDESFNSRLQAED